MADGDAWIDADPTLCDVCGREACEDHLPPTTGFPDAELEDAVDVAREGKAIAERGVRYVVEGLIPNYGVLGFLTAYTKVGKTTLGQTLSADVATGRPFLERQTASTRVLMHGGRGPA